LTGAFTGALTGALTGGFFFGCKDMAGSWKAPCGMPFGICFLFGLGDTFGPTFLGFWETAGGPWGVC